MKLHLVCRKGVICYNYDLSFFYRSQYHVILPADKYLTDKAFICLAKTSNYKPDEKSNILVLLPKEYFELIKDYKWIICCNENNRMVIILDDISPDDAIMLKLKWE